jgi:hypothetical protein
MSSPPRYDGLADWYDREIGGLEITTTAIDVLGRLVGAGPGVCLDLGCGTGGGRLSYVGIHPCFATPFVERRPTGAHLLHPGYRRRGWHRGPGFGRGIRPGSACSTFLGRPGRRRARNRAQAHPPGGAG